MASVLDDLRKAINKKYEKTAIGGNVCRIGMDTLRYKRILSLGSPSLDWMVYHRIPRGIFIEIAGGEGSGKTTLGACAIAASYIKDEKKMIAEAEEKNTKIIAEYQAAFEAAKEKGKKLPAEPVITPHKVQHIMFVDAEGTLDPTWALTATGYDINDEVVQTIYYNAYGQSAEQILDDIVMAVQSGEIGLVILDSLVAIAPQQVNDASMEKKDMTGIAKVLSDFVKRYTGLFNKYQTTFIGINGIYMDPSGYGNPEKIGGGTAWKRACSLRLKFKKGKPFDENGKELKEGENGAVGAIHEVALLKTKFCRWDRRLALCHLHYTKGMDLIQDTIGLAQLFNIIQEPSSSYFVVTDPDTGEVLTNKIHGEGNIKPYFEEHPDIWKRTYEKVYELMEDTESSNVATFESLLNLDTAALNEMFGVDMNKEAEL